MNSWRPPVGSSIVVESIELRIDGSDGSCHTLSCRSGAGLETVDRPSGPGSVGVATRIGADGAVVLSGVDASGTAVGLPEPDELERRTTLHGTVTERVRYAHWLDIGPWSEPHRNGIRRPLAISTRRCR